MAAQINVVGGGPSGLIAAEIAAAAGHRVTVFEHRRSVGRKFLLAGRSGLNLTHAEPLEQLIERYDEAAPVLDAALRGFDSVDLRAWSDELGENTFVGTSGRVFPQSMRATPMLRAWLARLTHSGVEFRTGHRWIGHESGIDRFESVDSVASSDRMAASGSIARFDVAADATILALGGASWPRVGSDGGWTETLREAGIEVTTLEPANCGVLVAWTDILRNRHAGDPIKNAWFSVGADRRRGDAVITDAGLEGGPIYALGPSIRRRLGAGDATITLNPFPDIDHSTLVKRLSKRRPGASVSSWLGSAGVPAVVAALAREVTANRLPNDPSELAALLQELPIAITSLAGMDRAISTAGGIALNQIDERFMLRQLSGVFAAGEMLDWEAPTGGYLLQACFSTGVAAANGAVAWLADRQA